MLNEGSLLWLYTETPLHAGGPESVGAIDLPIQRSVTTDVPVVWGQSLKGALKDHLKAIGSAASGLNVKDVFGSDPGDDKTSPGQVTVTEARVVAFPVPTFENCFAWVSSPSALAGAARLARLTGVTGAPKVPSVEDGQVTLADPARWKEQAVVVGAYVCKRRAEENEVDGKTPTAAWAAWLQTNAIPDDPSFKVYETKLGTDLLVVDDATFAMLTREFADVSARIALDENKVVKKGALFFEECLPQETILVSALLGPGANAVSKVLSSPTGCVANIGGSESVGRGLVWMRGSHA